MNLRYIVQYTFFFWILKKFFLFFLHFSHNFFYTCLIHDRGHLRSANKICIKKKTHKIWNVVQFKLLQTETHIWCHLIVKRWICFCSDNPKPSIRSKKHTKRKFSKNVNNGNKFDTKYLFTFFIQKIATF